MEAKDFRLFEIDPDRLPLDLVEEYSRLVARSEEVEIAGITFLDGETREITESGAVLYAPVAGRAGIAWGADAQWTDCDSVEDAVRRYLGQGEWVD